MTPACLQDKYGIPSTNGASFKSNIAVSGFLEEHFDFADLNVGPS